MQYILAGKLSYHIGIHIIGHLLIKCYYYIASNYGPGVYFIPAGEREKEKAQQYHQEFIIYHYELFVPYRYNYYCGPTKDLVLIRDPVFVFVITLFPPATERDQAFYETGRNSRQQSIYNSQLSVTIYRSQLSVTINRNQLNCISSSRSTT